MDNMKKFDDYINDCILVGWDIIRGYNIESIA